MAGQAQKVKTGMRNVYERTDETDTDEVEQTEIARPSEPTRTRPGVSRKLELPSLEMGQLLAPLRRYWWILLVVPLISAWVGSWLVQSGPTYYQGRVLIGVGPDIRQVKEDIPALVTIRLVSGYSKLVQQDNFLGMVVEQSKTGMTVNQLRQTTVVSGVIGTPYLEIQYVDNNSGRVITVLNTMRDLLRSQAPQARDLRFKSQQDFILARRVELNGLIENRKAELAALTRQEQAQTDAEKDIQASSDPNARTLNTVKGELESYKQELNDLDLYGSSNELNQMYVVDEPYLLPVKMGVQPRDAAVAMGVFSLALTIIVLALLEKFYPVIRSSRQVEELLGYPVIFARRVRQRRHGSGANSRSEAYDGLAAELVIAYCDRLNLTDVRLLMIHEAHTEEVTLKLRSLAQALARLGLATTVVRAVGRGRGERNQPRPEALEQDVIEIILPGGGESTSESGVEIGLQPIFARCELVSQIWPCSPRFLAEWSGECHGTLILCSLERSNKKALADLAQVIKNFPLPVKGILIV